MYGNSETLIAFQVGLATSDDPKSAIIAAGLVRLTYLQILGCHILLGWAFVVKSSSPKVVLFLKSFWLERGGPLLPDQLWYCSFWSSRLKNELISFFLQVIKSVSHGLSTYFSSYRVAEFLIFILTRCGHQSTLCLDQVQAGRSLDGSQSKIAAEKVGKCGHTSWTARATIITCDWLHSSCMSKKYYPKEGYKD